MIFQLDLHLSFSIMVLSIGIKKIIAIVISETFNIIIYSTFSSDMFVNSIIWHVVTLLQAPLHKNSELTNHFLFSFPPA